MKKKVIASEHKKEVKNSPSISRMIPELSKENIFYMKIIVASFISGILLMAISLKGYELIKLRVELVETQSQRSQLSTQLTYWENVAEDYSGYRDAYFSIAVLSFQLGDKKKARESLIEALALDPQFKEGREFGKKAGLL